MTKEELVAKIANESGITKTQAEKAVDGFVSTVSDALVTGDKITLACFGLSASAQGLSVKAAIPGPARR